MLKILVGKKAKGAELLQWEKLDREELVALASTPDMFGNVRIFVLQNALYGERGEELLGLADVFAESPHTFYLEEEKLLKAETTDLEKAGAKIEKQEKAEKPARGFDPFGVTAALGAKDRKKLWLSLVQSFRAGEKPEAVAGLLAWKARSMGDARLSRIVVELYHDAHRGAGELELLLERFALTL
jgi:hypothetical protein